MTIEDIRGRLVWSGIDWAGRAFSGAQYGGIVRGFKMCLDLEEPAEYLAVLNIRTRYEREVLADALFNGEITVEEYRAYRLATRQVAYVYEVLLSEWIRLGHLPPQPVERWAVDRYAEITDWNLEAAPHVAVAKYSTMV